MPYYLLSPITKWLSVMMTEWHIILYYGSPASKGKPTSSHTPGNPLRCRWRRNAITFGVCHPISVINASNVPWVNSRGTTAEQSSVSHSPMSTNECHTLGTLLTIFMQQSFIDVADINAMSVA